ncbi:MAG: gephyrin-like molybdotransferase Glp [Alphaproteobacteria bacterium]
MAQLKDDCFAFGGELMRTDEAIRILKERTVAIVGSETVDLKGAPGRILAGDLIAGLNVPPHDNAAVDGYAVYFDDLNAKRATTLPVTGRTAAGHALERPARRGEALRIFTGGSMPSGDGDGGPDTVLMQEDCELEGESVVIPPGIKQGANRRSAGEDIKAGAVILKKGHRLRPQDVALAASVGATGLEVFERLRVAVFSTGDEIYEPGSELPPGGIFDANRYALFGLLETLGVAVTDLGILEDRFESVRAALAEAAESHDLLITSGGASTGDEDHIKAAVQALGRLHFWRLAIRPGRPLALGQIGTVPFIGLPGNPVAVMVTFLRFARPLILGLSGATETEPRSYRVPVDFDYKKKAGRREWLRAKLVTGPGGGVSARKYAFDGAGILTSAVYADGLIELPEEMDRLSKGTIVDFLPFNELR